MGLAPLSDAGATSHAGARLARSGIAGAPSVAADVSVPAPGTPDPGSSSCFAPTAIAGACADLMHGNPKDPYYAQCESQPTVTGCTDGEKWDFYGPLSGNTCPGPVTANWMVPMAAEVVAPPVALAGGVAVAVPAEAPDPVAAVEVAPLKVCTWALGGVDGGDVFPLPRSTYSGAIVLASSLNDLHAARSIVTSLGYANTAPEHLVTSVLRYLRVVDIVLAGIGAIALGIAAMGVANALLAAVRERRREIGVLKAIGARDRDILRWFFLEAFSVGVVGGVVGTVAGLLIALWVGVSVNDYLSQQGLQSIQFGDVSWPLIAAAVLGSSLLAMAAGVVPALQAARLAPREAMAGA